MRRGRKETRREMRRWRDKPEKRGNEERERKTRREMRRER